MISNLTSMPHPIPGFVGLLLVAACGSSQPTDTAPSPTAPLPTAGLAGQRVVVYPLTLIAAHDTLGWTAAPSGAGPRRLAARRDADRARPGGPVGVAAGGAPGGAPGGARCGRPGPDGDVVAARAAPPGTAGTALEPDAA